MRLYEVTATYNGPDRGRTPFTRSVFSADDDTAAETFARFLLGDWTDSTITLARFSPAHIPYGYSTGDSLDVLGLTCNGMEWQQ